METHRTEPGELRPLTVIEWAGLVGIAFGVITIFTGQPVVILLFIAGFVVFAVGWMLRRN